MKTPLYNVFLKIKKKMESICKICSSITTLQCKECEVPFCSKECQVIDHIGARGKQTTRKPYTYKPEKKIPTKLITDYEVRKISPKKFYDIETIANHVILYSSRDMPPLYVSKDYEKYDNFPIKKGQKIGITHLIHGVEPATGSLPFNHIIYVMKRNDTSRNTYNKKNELGPYSDPKLTNITILKTNRKIHCSNAKSWCSDLSLEKIEKKAKDFHPDYILIWQSIIEHDDDKKYITNDELWFKQISLTFEYYDKVIESDKLIILGCALCINRSPHTLILYFMYHGINVLDAYKKVKQIAGTELFGWPDESDDIVKKLENIKKRYFGEKPPLGIIRAPKAP